MRIVGFILGVFLVFEGGRISALAPTDMSWTSFVAGLILTAGLGITALLVAMDEHAQHRARKTHFDYRLGN